MACCAAVLEDAAAELDGGPLRLLVLGYLPDEDTYAFTATSKTFLATVEQHNEICESKGQTPRAVKPPPASHFLKRVETTQWALDNGWTWPRGNGCAWAAGAGWSNCRWLLVRPAGGRSLPLQLQHRPIFIPQCQGWYFRRAGSPAPLFVL